MKLTTYDYEDLKPTDKICMKCGEPEKDIRAECSACTDYMNHRNGRHKFWTVKEYRDAKLTTKQ